MNGKDSPFIRADTGSMPAGSSRGPMERRLFAKLEMWVRVPPAFPFLQFPVHGFPPFFIYGNKFFLIFIFPRIKTNPMRYWPAADA
ncbi:MAG: hypothetical protein V4710_22050, partial [Verrucomicrobiota bacterium]